MLAINSQANISTSIRIRRTGLLNGYLLSVGIIDFQTSFFMEQNYGKKLFQLNKWDNNFLNR